MIRQLERSEGSNLSIKNENPSFSYPTAIKMECPGRGVFFLSNENHAIVAWFKKG